MGTPAGSNQHSANCIDWRSFRSLLAHHDPGAGFANIALGLGDRGHYFIQTDYFLTIEVMASVPDHDPALVNLYANLGNADPLVIATALDGQRTEEAALFGPTWIVVSGDKAVVAKVLEFGLTVKTNQEFLVDLEVGMNSALRQERADGHHGGS